MNPGRPGRAGARRAGPWAAMAGLILVGVLVTSCSEGENPLFNPGSHRHGLLALPDTLLVAEPAADRPIRAELATGAVQVLRVARTDSLEAIAYLQFGNFPDTVGVTAARLGIRLSGGQGTGLKVAAYEVVSDTAWAEVGILWDTRPGLSDEAFDTFPGRIDARDDTFLVERAVEIPGEMVRRWVREPDSNRGIALVLSGTSSDGVVEFLSRQAVLDSLNIANPPLDILAADSVVATLSPTKDAYVYHDTRPPLPADEPVLRVGEWLPTRALLRFDLPESLVTASDSIREVTGEDPRGITVNRALMRLYIDSPVIPEDLELGVYGIDGEWEESGPDSSITPDVGTRYDRISVEAELDSLGWSVSLDIGPLAQTWFDGGENHGVLVRALGETTGDRWIVFHSREASDQALRPRLHLTLTLPPDARWETGGEP